MYSGSCSLLHTSRRKGQLIVSYAFLKSHIASKACSFSCPSLCCSAWVSIPDILCSLAAWEECRLCIWNELLEACRQTFFQNKAEYSVVHIEEADRPIILWVATISWFWNISDSAVMETLGHFSLMKDCCEQFYSIDKKDNP